MPTFKSNNVLFLSLQVTMAGDYILAVASMMIARLRNDDVTLILSQVSQITFNTDPFHAHLQNHILICAGGQETN